MSGNAMLTAVLSLPVIVGLSYLNTATPAVSQTPEGLRPACVVHDDVNINTNYEMPSPYREMFLTPQAALDGVEIYTTGSVDNAYGSITLMYYQPNGRCLLWVETISLQEYSVRLGLEPYAVSPFYSRETNTESK